MFDIFLSLLDFSLFLLFPIVYIWFLFKFRAQGSFFTLQSYNSFDLLFHRIFLLTSQHYC